MWFNLNTKQIFLFVLTTLNEKENTPKNSLKVSDMNSHSVLSSNIFSFDI